jgi:hypothetical protein
MSRRKRSDSPVLSSIRLCSSLSVFHPCASVANHSVLFLLLSCRYQQVSQRKRPERFRGVSHGLSHRTDITSSSVALVFRSSELFGVWPFRHWPRPDRGTCRRSWLRSRLACRQRSPYRPSIFAIDACASLLSGCTFFSSAKFFLAETTLARAAATCSVAAAAAG